ncbi:hypothetical protein L202_01950 [Cryptococcus amylolentus CBS 6039]|uniref:Uncharacterized protein n=2 Tax=Cryptococcus amylolentus TaxID=104669 RepID=A0A1E3HYW6_9TREE|nr:hypothetical protein L202_01950 [Cryptococcus amylolentus CBS 6039]ODN81530.1 hypothetical protein L202_01950 [Cryptococcus amylolentus CBS 6039]ODO10239.1 hypothetical protein I350_02468 [Cryptococcus amylolentus CBS 6273]
MSVTASSLHSFTNDPSTLILSPGVQPTDLQRQHIGVVLDLFQAKGTKAKLDDNFTKDAVYEDLFASCKTREEVGGQLLHLPTVLSSTTTRSYTVSQIIPNTSTTDGTGRTLSTDLISIPIKHIFEFKVPLLPSKLKSVTMDSTLEIYSSKDAEGGKIVRLQDRPKENIPDFALLNWMRKFNAETVPKVVPLPKNDKEDAEKALKQQI